MYNVHMVKYIWMCNYFWLQQCLICIAVRVGGTRHLRADRADLPDLLEASGQYGRAAQAFEDRPRLQHVQVQAVPGKALIKKLFEKR